MTRSPNVTMYSSLYNNAYSMKTSKKCVRGYLISISKKALKVRNIKDLRIISKIRILIQTQSIGINYINDVEINRNIYLGERIRNLMERRSARIIYENIIKYIWRPGGVLILRDRNITECALATIYSTGGGPHS